LQQSRQDRIERSVRKRRVHQQQPAILRDHPPPLADCAPNASSDLAQAVARALAKKPEDRFPGARAMAAELKRIRARLESGEASTVKLPATNPPQTPQTAQPRSRWTLAVSALAAAALVAAAAVVLLVRREADAPPPMKLPPGTLAVAVLPVADQSGDPDLSRAGIGKILGDAFVQVLSDIPSVYVVSPIRVDQVARSLGRPLADAAQDPSVAHRVCDKAGAKAMLTGTLGRVGKTYVLNASLYELPSDRILGTFRAEAQNSEQLLPDLTSKVSGALRSKLAAATGPSAADGIERVATGSVEAYAHFVRGKEFSDEGMWKEAIPELQKAIEIDPQMAVAWTELACAYSFIGDDANAAAAQKKAESLLDHANKKERTWIAWAATWIQSGNGETYCAEGDDYIREFPDDREGYFYTGLGHEYLRKDCEKALVYYEKAYSLTPNYYPVTKAIADCRLKLNQKSRAVDAVKRYLALPFVSDHGRQQAQWRLEELKKGK